MEGGDLQHWGYLATVQVIFGARQSSDVAGREVRIAAHQIHIRLEECAQEFGGVCLRPSAGHSDFIGVNGV